jgi:hypothetical protein
MRELPDWHSDSDGESASNGPAVLRFTISDHASAAANVAGGGNFVLLADSSSIHIVSRSPF